MDYIEAPQTYNGNQTSLFLAGGITGCPDWQKELREKLKDTPLVLFNPRRASFPIEDKSAARAQIEWEHAHLRKATAISFWFPYETLNPIVLYELGAWSMTDKKLFVGAHPAYQRVQDIWIQTALVRPDRCASRDKCRGARTRDRIMDKEHFCWLLIKRVQCGG